MVPVSLLALGRQECVHFHLALSTYLQHKKGNTYLMLRININEGFYILSWGTGVGAERCYTL